MTKSTVLLIDDDQDVLDSYTHLMSIAGITSKALLNPESALSLITPDWNGVVVLDMYMPQMHGMDVLKAIKSIDERIPVIVITGHGDIPMAVEAVKLGACDFLEKPINPPQLLGLIKQHIDQRRYFIEQKLSLTRSVKKELVGKSAQIERIRSHIAQYAMLNNHVVICGESGVGRHTIAYLIHQLSSSAKAKPIAELAISNKTTIELLDDKLKESSGGCLLLDNIEQMSDEMQRHLIQVLLNQERLNIPRTRIIAILGAESEQLIANNHLLPELYYLLNQGVIEVPLLKQRPDDIAALFHYFLKQSCNKLGKSLPAVESSYLSLLRAHDWPGNVRELRNVAELYAIGIVKLTGKDRVYNQVEMTSPLDELVDDYEKQIIEDALFLYSGRVAEAANYLQIPRKKLYLRMKKHGIEKDEYKSRG
ncbi:sigma-54 dependent transcriptional regulator [Vibrio plantisponsor]|uniref:Sigma-54 dependent transcriptional regulator n=1 Tax=Vibrio plantisponsor TaxID=664643 RepID=A0ABU4IH67_9VIBR|nr:sigma-54 dependent transcriptional regulator [Vibrio plantisponsor]MDW6017907.1 sigma-54 dependent transcriptional regulator [Vibrio plantisponsor]NNM39684.1 sigma-54-dependent Fis family transcriptional regulator [Vibrio plantisponsor]